MKKNSENLETTAKEAKKCIDEMDDFLGKNKMFFTATLRCSNNRKLCFFSYEKRRIVKPNGAIYLSVLTPITYDVSEKRKFRRFTTVELSPFEYKFEVMTRDEFENGLLMARLTTFEFSDERDLIEYDNFLRNLFSMEEE